MSTNPSPPAIPTPPLTDAKREIRIISHSNLFYWWPVWAIGFLLSIITWSSGQVLAIVPEGTKAEASRQLPWLDGNHDVLVVPEKRKLLRDPQNKDEIIEPHLKISASKNLGILFCTVLLLVIVITNVPLRGLWSVIVILTILSLTIIFALLDWWDPILRYLRFLDIRINLGGYLFLSGVLFVIWLIVFLFFDKQIYMVFTPGQFRVRLEIGDAETAYDTTGHQ